MRLRLHIWALLATVVLSAPYSRAAESGRLLINERRWHLGQSGAAEWEEFAAHPPNARRLELTFQADASERESTLFIRQDDVRHDWLVELNGRRLGKLFLMEADLVSTLTIPAGVLREGDNQLTIVPPAATDDIILQAIWLKSGSPREAIEEASLSILVREGEGGPPIPARITIVDDHGTLVPLTTRTNATGQIVAAVRPGVVYVGTGGARLGMLAGEYTVYATRGFEYGVQAQRVRLAKGEAKALEFVLRREVPTAGWVSCDTHVHTLTHSGHGDATLDERILTLAGEGIELPIATDHNYHADYREPAERMGVRDFFTPVTGNEVTTGTAHFNIFPVEPSARVVDFRIGGGPALATAMRATPDVKVVVLNHPLNVHNGFQPFAPTNFNNVTGEHLGGPKFSFDALELLSSSAQQTDFMAVFRGWFALLNHGERVTGVGSSDGHDVSRYIVGQSRTYLAVDDSAPGTIDISQACDALLAGRALVSLGLLVNLRVNDLFGVGDLATNLAEQVEITAQVRGPSWTEATNVVLFANGQPVFKQAITGSAGRAGEKALIRWRMPRPAHDVHLVAIATGPGVTAPYWAIPRPYQPTSRQWIGRVIGATNPIWLDADGDGRFTAARGYARRLIDQRGPDPVKIIPALAQFDEAVAAQVASLLNATNVAVDADGFRQSLAKASDATRRGFESYVEARNASRP